MLRDVSVHNTKLVIDFLNSHEELFTREAARYATEKMNPRDKSQVKLFDKAVQRRGRAANRKETEQDAKEATEESSLVESEESGKSAKKSANGVKTTRKETKKATKKASSSKAKTKSAAAKS